MSKEGVVLRLPSRTTTVVVSTIGAGILFFGIFLRRWLKQRNTQVIEDSIRIEHVDQDTSLNRQENGRTSRIRCTPSISERSTTRASLRRNQQSSHILPADADIVYGAETCQDLIRIMERGLSALELVKNRSDKDKSRVELLSSVLDRLRVLETDISRIAGENSLDDVREDGVSSGWAGYQSPRAGTLSVLSDDSFMSALEDMPVMLDDDDNREDFEIDESKLQFYQSGLEAVANGQVSYRKARSEFCNCANDVDFAAKLWCIRQAFQVIFTDDHKRLWLAKAGRSLVGDILRHSKQETNSFYKAYDATMEFFEDSANIEQMQEELTARGVREFGFYDVVLDFIFMDVFEDLKQPPSAIYSVTRNCFLSTSMKFSTLSTVIWSMLKAKRQRLKYPRGFIAHFYDISEAASPALTLGMLGTDESLRELCHYFKDQIMQMLMDIFNMRRVRYTSLKEMAEDVWVILESRTEAAQTRLSSELLPA